MERATLVYTTYPSLGEAERAGQAIVGQRLAACVNILPGMISHYWWEGRVERGEEVVMIIKTRASLAEAVQQAVKASHPTARRRSWCCRSRRWIRLITPGFWLKRTPRRVK